MVKIINEGPEIKDDRERISKLKKIAEQTLGDNILTRDLDPSSFSIYTTDKQYGIIVSYNNTILVTRKEGFDDMFKLAEAYESQEEQEFTLQKMYH